MVIENDPIIDITEVNNEGIYSFRVKNYNEQDKVTETDLKYYIEIIGNIDQSINLELFQGDNKVELTNNRTEFLTISKEEKQEIEYKIKLTYDKTKSNSITDIMERLQVKVHTEQARA